MELYTGDLRSFVEAAKSNRISEDLSVAYRTWFGRNPGERELRSWNNSLVRLKDALDGAVDLDTGVFLEYQLPLSSLRLDCMVTGNEKSGKPAAEIIELKQWESCTSTEEESLVVTWVGGRNRAVLHPAAQVDRYQQYLMDGHSAFYGSDLVTLNSCAYLHNYRPKRADALLDAKFDVLRHRHPVFLADDYSRLRTHLNQGVGFGGGVAILNRIRSSKAAPSKQLLKHVGRILKGIPAFTLLDEQLVIYESVIGSSRRVLRDQSKCCIVVRGGPGTGKSVIAINLMSDLARKGVNARYATGSKAFTTTLRKIAGARGSSQFDFTLSYARAQENQVDALIVDEAHRIRQTSSSRWTAKTSRSGLPQVEELLRAGRVTIFFIDNLQAVRPDEVGTSAYIIENAKRLGIPVMEFDLEVQFRCQGSDAFVSWIDAVLGLSESGPSNYHPSENFDLRILDTPEVLESEIRSRVAGGSTGRLTAGFCWPWSDPLPDGALVDDVQINGFRRPWNARPDAGRLAKGIPRAPLWAYDPKGLDQIGCVYTAQGFEFDYVGVIVGPDLVVDKPTGAIKGTKVGSKDPAILRSGEMAPVLIRRAYRILLSRGLKGCYIAFTDPAVREKFEHLLIKG